MNPKTTEPCRVVLRIDPDGTETVKLVTWSQAEAERQVRRLNALNDAKGYRYHSVISRALRRPQAKPEPAGYGLVRLFVLAILLAGVFVKMCEPG